jgi:hypothetical protein
MKLFREGKELGTHSIKDNDNWAGTLNSLGASPTQTTSPTD